MSQLTTTFGVGICILLSTTPSIGRSEEGIQKIVGFGSANCEYLNLVRSTIQDRQQYFSIVEQWLAGFISGVQAMHLVENPNSASSDLLPGAWSLESYRARVELACEDNPLSTISAEAFEIYRLVSES